MTPPPGLWSATAGLLALAALGIGAGAVAAALGASEVADIAFAAVAIVSLAIAAWSVVGGIIRRSPGVDVIAVLAIAGAVTLQEYLAGAVIGLMLATGRALEEYASRRAGRELSNLLQRAPRSVSRVADGSVAVVPVEAVVAGDLLLIRQGDVVPVDGLVVDHGAVLEESALTGESRPADRAVGDQVRSGATNAGAPFQLRATATAADSTYAGIVRMVREAQAAKAPLVRLADRYARVFVPIALATAVLAWAVTGDPRRALAVLVVATPCPLLLAAPVAIAAGVSQMARRGIVSKGGAALEVLARGQVIFVDKTGTLTSGRPRLQRIAVHAGAGVDSGEILRLAASLDQVSPHVLAGALIGAARERGLPLVLPRAVVETPGAGIEGRVESTLVRLGTFDWTLGGRAPSEDERRFRRRTLREEGSAVFAAVDDQLAGAFVFDDPIRPDAPRALRLLKRLGFSETVMLTGDHVAIAESVGAAIGVDRVLAGVTPAEKVEAVSRSRERAVTVMVGDGINDAPALAAADVGVAMGARGATSSSEAADLVLVVDRLDRVVEAVEIARRSRGIAVQSVVAGMGLSIVAMGVAAGGYLPPAAGALVQEGIDAAAILNALRALRGGRRARQPRVPPEIAAPLRAEHVELLPQVDVLREVADLVGALDAGELRRRLEEARQVVALLVEHEREDERRVYRALSATLDGDDPMAAMSRTHQEIFHLCRAFERMLADVPPAGPDPEDLVDIRRTLYALHAVLRLNIAQEEELYHALDSDAV